MMDHALIEDDGAKRLRRLEDLGVAALLVVLPLLFGGVQPSGRELLAAGVVVLSVLWVIRTWRSSDPGPISPLVWPLWMAVMLGWLQWMPLPRWVGHAVAPGALAWRETLLEAAAGSGQTAWPSLSAYRWATFQDLGSWVTWAALLTVITCGPRRRPDVQRHLQVLAVIGAVVALIALFQAFLGGGRIYGIIEVSKSRGLSGPFVNHSHFGQFMNLTIGAALALWLMHWQRLSERHRGAAAALLRDPAARRLGWLGGAMVVAAAAVFVSLTRAGVVSLLAATTVVCLLVGCERALRGRAWLILGVALASAGCVLLLGFDAVCERLATLLADEGPRTGRWSMLRDGLRLWRLSPWVGMGLGSFQVTFGAFDRSFYATWATHADCEWLNVLTEAGLAGCALVLVFLGLVWRRWVTVMRGSDVVLRAGAIGIAFSLVAALVHSLVDFGQHVPANAVTILVLCAVLDAMAHSASRAPETTRHGRRGAVRVLGTLLLVIQLPFLVEADQARRAASAWRQARQWHRYLAERQWEGSDAQFVSLLRAAQRARDLQPGQVQYGFWLNAYRWRTLARVQDPNVGTVTLVPEAVEAARRVVAELAQVRRWAPTYGPSACLQGQIQWWVLGDPEGRRLIELAGELSPCDPSVQMALGLLAAEDGRADQSLACFQQAVRLDEARFAAAAQVLVVSLRRPDLALTLAGDRVTHLGQLAELLTRDGQPDDTSVAQDTRHRVLALLEQRCRDGEATASNYACLAELYRREGRWDEAITAYRQALDLEYGRVSWRLALAGVLEQVSAFSEALHEARVCLRLQPHCEQARALVARLAGRVREPSL